ncbi:MAG: hypothetical protein KGD64_02930 [Candidatus Heimdallarchaeota archaeon]|nr:hypothetical protein [Candidatus Heimdallarchaeota archaeon]
MAHSTDKSKFMDKEHIRLSTILMLLIVDGLVYFVPYRNDVLIGDLFGISLWFYFGILNAILLILVYIFFRGEVELDFSTQELIFREFKKLKKWQFNKVLGIYLLAYDGEYLLRIRPKRLLTLDIRVNFDDAYYLVDKFKELGFEFKTVRDDKHKPLSYTFPILLSKYDQKPSGYNPEIPNWNRGVTLRTKLLSITLSPMLYIISATLIVRIPHLLDGLAGTKGLVSFIYGFTAFLLFDGGLYLLFGISLIALLLKQINRFKSHSHSSDKS